MWTIFGTGYFCGVLSAVLVILVFAAFAMSKEDRR